MKNARYVLRLGMILLLITAVAALLLGAVNSITESKIRTLLQEKTDRAKAEVLPAQHYVEVSDFSDDTGLVKALWRADEAGYVANCVVGGSQGDIELMVGVDTQGVVSGISIVAMKETSGLGDNAKKAEWREGFVGKSGQILVDKDGGEITALTGATVTSRAVCRAATAAVACVEKLG